jgi:hypothetical protein
MALTPMPAKRIDVRGTEKMLKGEANSHRLRRPDKSVHIARGVYKETNDDT